MSGILPTSIGSLNLVTDLSVFGNEITGSIPLSIGSLSNLALLDVSQNKLGGKIPDSICHLPGHAHVELNNLWCRATDYVGNNWTNVSSVLEIGENVYEDPTGLCGT